jgi:glycosyltransferase involved in cell wall biosynthesis
LHYLRATVDSARECIEYPNLEWIVSDNNSVEPGIAEYINSLDWVQKKLFSTQSHAEAMNELVSTARGKYILIWPEDIQFVVKGDWLVDIIEVLEKCNFIGSVGINFLRHSTVKQLFTMQRWLSWRLVAKELYYFRNKFRFQQRLRSRRGFELRTLGHLWPGICGSGIPTLTRTEVWRAMGGWRTLEKRNLQNLLDSSLGAEANMVQRFYENGEPLQQAVLSLSVAADIVTDPIGSKAKVRGDKRYGVYMPPPTGRYYYEINDQCPSRSTSSLLPRPFEDSVKPLGFSLPLDENGNLKKADHINMNVIQEIVSVTTSQENIDVGAG